MISQNDIDQFETTTTKEFNRLFAARRKYKSSHTIEAADFVAHVEDSLLFLIKKTGHDKWMCQWASTHPVSAILFLNNIHHRADGAKFGRAVTRAIQTSEACKILQSEHAKKCSQFLTIAPLSDPDLKILTVLDIFNVQNGRQNGRRENEPLFISDSFKAAAGEFETIPQIWAVRDAVRRQLVCQALIDHDFKTRAAARSLGCKSEGALAGNVRALFGTSDFKRETIEPVIRSWKQQENQPFQHVVNQLSALKTFEDVEKQLEEFYTALTMKAAEKCQFVKSRMADFLDVSEKTVNTLLTGLSLEKWYKKSHEEFLMKTGEAVDYNWSQVAVLLNVDVRYVTQQLTNYGIEKSNGTVQPRSCWPR